MGVSAKITVDRSREFARGIQRVTVRRLRRVGEMVRGEVVEVLGQHHSRAAGPSPAGTPPGIDTGMLRKSIEYSVDEESLEVRVGSALQYAAIHEFGGYAGRGRKTFIPARPYLTPTAARMQPEAERILLAPITDAELGL